jgi:hypothetical protein
MSYYNTQATSRAARKRKGRGVGANDTITASKKMRQAAIETLLVDNTIAADGADNDVSGYTITKVY